MNKLHELFLYLCYLRLPIKKKVALFSSFFGMYSDNPKYISEELHRRDPSIKIVWAISEKCHEKLPEYITPVKFGSKGFYKYACRAQILVDNNLGIRMGPIFSYTSKLGRIRARLLFRKKSKQFSVSTWHGMPLKHISGDEPDSKLEKVVTASRYLCAGNSFTEKCMKSAFRDMAPIRLYGSARNDILFRKDVDKDKLREKLRIPKDRKIIVYAPTFRNDVMTSGVSQMQEIDCEKLFHALAERFHSEWCLVVRAHDHVVLQINFNELAEESGGRVINGNLGDDMAEYLACADVLLTDYSSSMFDFALTKKPCFLWAPDREHYETVERGFYLNFDELPFPKAMTCEELYQQISAFDEEEYRQSVDRFLTEIGNIEDGHAAERVVDDILEFVYRKK